MKMQKLKEMETDKIQHHQTAIFEVKKQALTIHEVKITVQTG